MSVYENIRYQLLDYSEDFKNERINTVLELCNLTELQSRKPREISGGQQQRVALANALATDPKVLLMDEPFSNLDPYTKADILQSLQDIAKKTSTAIIIVTHDPADSLMVADKIAFLENGNLIQLETPETIYYNPANIKIGKFFGYLSILSPGSCKKLGISPKDGNTCIRAEDVKISSTGLKFTVLNSIWKGHYRVLVLEQENFDPLLAFDYSNTVRKNDIVHIGLDKAAIINIAST
jgi:iron(III) transport system ATP-binding protein